MIRACLVIALLLVVVGCDGEGASTTATTGITQATTTTSNPGSTTSPPDTTTTTSSTTTATLPPFDLIEVDVASAPGRVPVELGRTIRLVVTADVSDEVHLHGYDIRADVAPGMPAVLEFVADIPGIFDVELEAAGQEFMQLQVEP